MEGEPTLSAQRKHEQRRRGRNATAALSLFDASQTVGVLASGFRGLLQSGRPQIVEGGEVSICHRPHIPVAVDEGIRVECRPERTLEDADA